MKKLLCLVAMLFVLCACHGKQDEDSSKLWHISDGYVPDEAMAIDIAKLVGKRIYGKRILNEMPLKAILVKDVWIIDGTNLESDGGVVHVEIQKADGKILIVTHGK